MTPWVRPPRLRPGATIGVAAVSGPADLPRLDRGIAALERKGYRVARARNLDKRSGFLAGSDLERAAGYLDLLEDPSVEAIFFARGGYGSSRMLRHLTPEAVSRRPRIHLGASDLTALFAYLGTHARLTTFYGPLVELDVADEEGLDWEPVLHGEPPPDHRFRDADVLAGGRGEGRLAGGCLSLAASLAGTPEAIDARDAVFFWEDVNEPVYRMDRMLTQLERSGTFDRLQAMVIGSISPGGVGGDPPEAIDAWLRERFAGAPFPVVRGFPAGHLPRPRTLPLGAAVRVDADAGVIAFPDPAVE